MRIIKPNAILMEHCVPPYEFIEKVGRTCYKSENLITEGSAEKFVKGLVNRQHWAMLEHETLFLVVSDTFMEDFMRDMQEHLNDLKFFNFTNEPIMSIISGSFRSFHDLFEKGYDSRPINHIKWIMQTNFPIVFGEVPVTNPSCAEGDYYLNEDCMLFNRQKFIDVFGGYNPEIIFHHLTHTFLFICDRGVSHEFVRHRVASFAQESTRYCNYAKDKFGNEITVIKPCFWNENSAEYTEWKNLCEQSEKAYFNLLTLGSATPQEARSVLPNSLKTEIIITATEEEWQHIVNLRYLGTTGASHPQMKEAMSFALADIIIETEGRVNLNKGEK